MAKDYAGISKKIVDAATEALKEKGWPTLPCACAAARPTVSTLLFEAPDASGAKVDFVPPMVYVFCETCGASVPYVAERLIGRGPLKAILKGEPNR